MPATISRRPEAALYALAGHTCLGGRHHHHILCDFLKHHHAGAFLHSNQTREPHSLCLIQDYCAQAASDSKAYMHNSAHKPSAAHQSL